MKESKHLYDSWFEELFEDLNWEFICKEQNNYNKAVDLATSFLASEEETEFMFKWIFGRPKPFCDFIFCIKNESRNNIYPQLHP